MCPFVKGVTDMVEAGFGLRGVNIVRARRKQDGNLQGFCVRANRLKLPVYLVLGAILADELHEAQCLHIAGADLVEARYERVVGHVAQQVHAHRAELLPPLRPERFAELNEEQLGSGRGALSLVLRLSRGNRGLIA